MGRKGILIAVTRLCGRIDIFVLKLARDVSGGRPCVRTSNSDSWNKPAYRSMPTSLTLLYGAHITWATLTDVIEIALNKLDFHKKTSVIHLAHKKIMSSLPLIKIAPAFKNIKHFWYSPYSMYLSSQILCIEISSNCNKGIRLWILYL